MDIQHISCWDLKWVVVHLATETGGLRFFWQVYAEPQFLYEAIWLEEEVPSGYVKIAIENGDL